MSPSRLSLTLSILIITYLWLKDFPHYWSKEKQNVVSPEGVRLEPSREIEHLENKMALLKNGRSRKFQTPTPKIFIVTPTYARPHQKAELTRFSHTLMLVPNIHWIVVEDSNTRTALVKNVILDSGIEHTHLNVKTPDAYAKKKNRRQNFRGVIQRNLALDWIREWTAPDQEGVLYFADDDNSYSLALFEEMRFIKTVGVWPVGLVGGVMVERPRVSSQGKVIGWAVVFGKQRKFATDMAGFATSLRLIHNVPSAKFSYKFPYGNQENYFLQLLVKDWSELEPKASNCTKVLVWHTKTASPFLFLEEKLKTENKTSTDFWIEV